MEKISRISLLILICWLNLSSATKDTYGSTVYKRYSACQENKNENTFDFNSRLFLIQPPKMNSSEQLYYGTVGIVGGLSDTVGALNFAGMGALRVGSEEVHIYLVNIEKKIEYIRPDFVMHHYLTSELKSMLENLKTMNVIVVGPGLERVQNSAEIVKEVIRMCKNNNKPLIVELSDYFHAEGVIFKELANYPEPGVIVMLNSQEFEKVYPHIKLKEGFSDAHVNIDFDSLGPNVLIYRKGCVDMAFTKYPENSWSYTFTKENNKKIMLKRCKGQGSVIAGMTATFFNWYLKDGSDEWKNKDAIRKASAATYVGAKTMRLTNDYTVGEGSRSIMTSDMVKNIPKVLWADALNKKQDSDIDE